MNALPQSYVVILAAAVGSVLGSFLNVCIVRLPADESVVRPRSRCPQCGRSIAWYDNIPVLSWLVLRGKCRACGTSISLLYPVVELLTAGIWAGSFALYGMTITALAGAVFGTILLGIGVTDARTYLIPDEYTIGGLGIGLALAAFGGLAAVIESAIGAAVGFGLLYLIAVAGEHAFKKEAMGGGDIKMMAMVGAFLGWQGVPLTVFGGALLGTVVFLPIQAIRAAVAKSHGETASELLVPFGVFLAAAAGLTFLVGDRVVDWYMGYVAGA